MARIIASMFDSCDSRSQFTPMHKMDGTAHQGDGVVTIPLVFADRKGTDGRAGVCRDGHWGEWVGERREEEERKLLCA